MEGAWVISNPVTNMLIMIKYLQTVITVHSVSVGL